MNAGGGKPEDRVAGQVCTRRSFLLAALAGALGVRAVAGCTAPNGTGTTRQKWSAWLLTDNASRDAAVRLGKAYLHDYPADADKRVLLAEVDKVIAVNLQTATPGSADPLQLGAALEQAVRTEYADDKVVTVQGWVLSLTEARLYASVALINGINGDGGIKQ
jgi:hypothetical protein